MPSNIFQVDPESLALHIDASLIGSNMYAESNLELLDLCLSGEMGRAIETVKTLDFSAKKDQSVDFLSQYIHELRHHVDLLVSPYGWYRLRANLEVLQNLPYLLISDDFDQIPIPLSTAADKLDSSFLGLTNKDFQCLSKLAIPLDSRRRVIGQDNAPVNIDGDTYIQSGGESILEALAYYSQRSWIGMNFPNQFHSPYFKNLIFPEQDSEILYKYHWPALLFSSLEKGPFHSVNSNEIEAFVVGLLNLSLNGTVLKERRYGKSLLETPAHLTSRDVTKDMPSGRLALIYEYIQSNRITINDLEDVFSTLNDISIALFKRSFLEDLALDIELNEIFIQDAIALLKKNPIPNFSSIANVYEKLLSQRRELFEIISKDPKQFVVPHFFGKYFSSKRVPDSIYFFQREQTVSSFETASKLKGEWRGLHNLSRTEYKNPLEKTENESAYSFWLIHENSNHHSSSSDMVEGFCNFYGYQVPIYKFLTYGFKYNSMSEVELLHGKALLEMEKTLLIDPNYRFSGKISKSDYVTGMLGRSEIICDHCNIQTTAKESAAVSPLTTRQNEGFWDEKKSEVAEALSSDQIQVDSIRLNAVFHSAFGSEWSDWVLCNTCLAHFRFE